MMDLKDSIIDFDEPREKGLVLAFIRGLTGKHRVEIVRYRKRRSDLQNRLYWVAVVEPFADFLRQQDLDYRPEQAHEILKFKFLKTVCVNPKTGELIAERTRSTTELNTAEFVEYIEKCVAWLADMFDIVVKLPGEEWSELCTSNI